MAAKKKTKRVVDFREDATVYQWKRDTFELIGSVEVKPNPFKQDAWLVPARATSVVPPKAREGYTIKWDGKKWYNCKD